MRYVSIAKDFYYETSASTLSYYITCNGRTVYWGISVKPSGSPVNRINIRKRIADYLEIDMPDFRDYDGVVIPHPEQLRDFELYSSDGTLLETYRALLGYYDEWDGNVDEVLSDPVNGHTDPRQKIFWGAATNITGGTGTTEIEMEIIDPPYIYFLIDTPIRIPAQGGNYDIRFLTNADFSFSYIGDWLNNASAEDGVLHISTSKNETGSERTATVCFHFYGESKCFDVIQEAESEYLTFEILSAGTIEFRNYNVDTDIVFEKTVEYSLDGGESWTAVSSSRRNVINVSEGDTVLWRGDTSKYSEKDLYGAKFDGTAVLNIRGNLRSLQGGPYAGMFSGMSVVDASKLVLSTSANGYYYSHLFANCEMLEKAPLSVTSVSGWAEKYCCEYMFANCHSLKVPPGLPCKVYTEYCYHSMFINCTSLETAPILPSSSTIEEKSCDAMFYNCTSLVNVQKELKNNVVEHLGYANMFQKCSSLKSTPTIVINEIRGAYSLAGMFALCTSLKEANSITVNNSFQSYYNGIYTFENMFKGCTSLKKAAELYVPYCVTDMCTSMYSGCTSLEEAFVPKYASLAEGCYNSMYAGCTSLVNPPDLGDRALAEGCYRGMFAGCTSLKTTPRLRQYQLADGCYAGMFSGCTSLESIYCTAGVFGRYSTDNWVKGINNNTGTFTKKSGVSWPTGDSGIPDGWTVVEV